MTDEIWIIGAGLLSGVYVEILREQGFQPKVISRGEAHAKKLRETFAVEVSTGGLNKFLETKPPLPAAAMVVVGIEALASVSIELLNYGVSDILCEKPGAMELSQLQKVNELVKEKNARCIIGYNRRCYASVNKAKQLLEEDGGITSFSFEFTEISDRVRNLSKADGVLAASVLGNCSHVIDLAFFFGGSPRKLFSLDGGSGELYWHPSGSRFVGCGETETGALFSYQADFNAPGRWSVELMSKNFRFILKPLEELRVMRRNEFEIKTFEIEDNVDRKFKPGFYEQIAKFMDKRDETLCSVQQQLDRWSVYKKIGGY